MDDKRLENAALGLKNAIQAENAYKNTAILTYGILIIIAFFVSLGSADFDFSKILKAQFWIDFMMTFGGGMLLKYAFGRWGDWSGHKNESVVKTIAQINADHAKIEEKGLLEDYKEYIDTYDKKRKLAALKNKTFKKLRRRVHSKKWKVIKESIIIYENILYDKIKDKEKLKENLDKLNENNFDIDSFKIKYNKIRKDTLETGFANPGNDDEKMTYSEVFQLFGRNIAMTLLSVTLTFVLAVTHIFLEDISLVVLAAFVQRVGVYSMNAYLGFATSKSGVEKVKLNVLKNIHKFLSTFIEIKTKEVK